MTEPMTSNVTDTALLFEGGGMRAALTSAVVAELLRERIHVDFVAGISAGSSNAVNYLSRDPARARRSFVDFADDPRFGNWLSFVRGKGLFNAEYIYEHAGLPEADLPYDFATFRANPARLVLGTGFLWSDLLLYLVGVGATAAVDTAVRLSPRGSGPRVRSGP